MTHLTRIIWVFCLCLTAMSASACNRNAPDTTSNAQASALTTTYSEGADRTNPDASTAEACVQCSRCGTTPCPSCMRRPDASNCAQRALRGVAAPEGEDAPARSAPVYEASGAPEGTDVLAAQLRVHHAEDAPTGEALREVDGAEPALHYLAEHGALMLERQRALVYLRHFPSDETRALLLRVASSDAQRQSLRVIAFRSLEVLSDPGDEDVQQLRTILEVPASDDAPRRASPLIEATMEELP